REGSGGCAARTACVPSKTLIATAEVMANLEVAPELGITVDGGGSHQDGVDLTRVNKRVLELARAQSHDIESRLPRDGVRVLRATGRLDGPQRVVATTPDGDEETLDADAVLVATGAAPRTLPTARPDGARLPPWEQAHALPCAPHHLVVGGPGRPGAEVA